MMNCENLSWLENLQSRGIKPGLDNIGRLLSKLGNPEKSLRTIHVAGSDGKGSVCAMLESILDAAGMNVGMFTSPHIIKVNESIRASGHDISDVDLESVLGEVRSAADDDCTNFEALTAAAFLFFRKENVDFAIIEVGMGGRLDSTNVITPAVSVINNISMEHTRFLGDTLEKIASEKAGIMKPNVPCITANKGPALDVISEHSKIVGCPLTVIDKDEVEVLENTSDHVTFRYGCRNYSVGLPGRYQALNAALSIEAVRAMGIPEIEPFIEVGLENAAWPCRLQRIDDFPLIVDGTHTKKGAECIASDVSEIYGKVVLILGMLEDKDIEGVAGILSPIADKVIVASPSSPRAASADRLARAFSNRHDIIICDSIGEALDAAMECHGDLCVLATGSFRTAEDCIKWLRTRT